MLSSLRMLGSGTVLCGRTPSETRTKARLICRQRHTGKWSLRAGVHAAWDVKLQAYFTHPIVELHVSQCPHCMLHQSTLNCEGGEELLTRVACGSCSYSALNLAARSDCFAGQWLERKLGGAPHTHKHTHTLQSDIAGHYTHVIPVDITV